MYSHVMCLFSFLVSDNETGSVRERILKEKEASIGMQESVLEAAKLSESNRKLKVKLKEKDMQCQKLRKEKGKLLN